MRQSRDRCEHLFRRLRDLGKRSDDKRIERNFIHKPLKRESRRMVQRYGHRKIFPSSRRQLGGLQGQSRRSGKKHDDNHRRPERFQLESIRRRQTTVFQGRRTGWKFLPSRLRSRSLHVGLEFRNQAKARSIPTTIPTGRFLATSL